MPRLISALLILFVLYGCASPPTSDSSAVAAPPEALGVPTNNTEKAEKPTAARTEPTPEVVAEQELRLGITAYENGQHKKSQQSLKNALALGLSNKSDKVAANKYLAFMACANQQREACKGYFRKAIAADAKFDLGKSEAGHPMWGGVFKEVKVEAKIKGSAKSNN
jgi:Spy/CpxP family protein refolding chaperone